MIQDNGKMLLLLLLLLLWHAIQRFQSAIWSTGTSKKL